MKNQINIFIVDDNKIFSMALKASIETAFENIHFNLHSFETGEECMEKFIQIKPEIVILDYYLNSNFPEAADGLQILHKIKNNNFNTNVIMLTSNDRIDIALKSFHHGVFDYVVKSTSQFKKINNSISKILAKKELDFVNSQERKNQATEFITINKQKIAAETSKLAVEEKNKNITDSINYAKRIQNAKLPKKEEILASLPQCFILFNPKDIVSGDFYFFHKKEDTIYIAAADCTGHGVPGAFMSMIGSEQLMDAVLHSNDTSEILKQLNKGIKKSLQQSDSVDSTRDGMDIAICSIDQKNLTLKYSGANRPLWIIRKDQTEVEEIKGTKKAIGGLTEDEQQYECHKIQLHKGDAFYIFTDGYADQFGGESKKKLMTKLFKEILLSIQDKSMQEQRKYLNNFMHNWRSGIEQVDDMLVIGVQL
jgi:serine phosphatase RsbU (regulator of sigma subunit)